MPIIDKLRVNIGANIDGLKKGVKDSKATLGDLDKSGKKTATGLTGGFNNFFKVIKTQLLALGPLIAGTFAISSIVKFYKEIDNARATLIRATGASGEALKGLEQITTDVFKKVPESLDIVANVVGGLNTRLGITGEILEDTTKKILDFSRITGTDATQNVKDITRLMQDWGVEVENTSGILDLLTQAGLDADVSVNQITNTLTNSGVQLRTLGFSLGEATALLARFEKEGVNTAGILSGLNRGVNELAQTAGKSVPEAFGDFIKSLEDAKSDSEALALATQTLGTIAGPQFALAVREGRFELDDYIESLKNADGVTNAITESSRTKEEQFKVFGNRLKGETIPILTNFGNTIGWLGNSILDLGGIIKRTLKFIGGLFATTLIIIGESIGNTLKWIFDNIKLVPQNFGIAFDNIPGAIEKGLKQALRLVGQFINKLTLGLGGKVSKALGLGNVVDDLNFFGSKDIQFKSVGFQDFDLTKKSLKGLGESFNDITSNINKDIEGTIGNVGDLFKNTAKEINTVTDNIDKINEKTGKGVKEQEEIKKETEDREKERLERYEKFLESRRKEKEEKEKAHNVRMKDLLKGLEDGYKNIAEVYDEAISKSETRTKEFENKIKDLRKTIEGIKDELQSLEEGRGITLGERNISIDKEIERLRAEEIIDIQTINKLLEEKRLIEANASREELEEAKRISKLSPTALFLEQFEKKKLALEEDKMLREEELKQIEIEKEKERLIFENLTNEKEKLDLRYEKINSGIEDRITDKLHIETRKRIAFMEEQRQKAIQLAEALSRVGLAVNESSRDISSSNNSNSTQVNIYGNQNFNNGTDIDEFSESLSWKIK